MTAPYHFVGDGVPTSRIVGGRCPHRPAHVIPSQCSHWRGNPFPLYGGVRAPRPNVTFDGCEFKSYTNREYANNSNPIWWRSDMEDLNAPGNRTPIKSFTFVNNTVVGTRPIKIERVGMWDSEPVFTFKNNTFNISAQADDTEIKNMAINIGQKDGSCSFTLIDEGNTISDTTAALYTAARGSGSNQYFAVSGNKVLNGNGNEKSITAKEWKTGVPFELKSVD